ESRVLELLASLRVSGQAVLLVSHDAEVVEQLADRVIHLADGALVASAPLPIASVSESTPESPTRSERKSHVVLRASSLSVAFPGKQLIENFDFELHAGETVAITGESGIGKTTLCRVLAGLRKPQSGTVYLQHLDS